MIKKLIILFLLICSTAFAQENFADLQSPESVSILNDQLRILRKRIEVAATGFAHWIFLPQGFAQNSSVPDRTSDGLYLQFDSTSTETADIPSVIIPSNFDADSPVTYQISWENSDAGADTIAWRLKNSFAETNADFGSYSSGDQVTDLNNGVSNQNLTEETTITESWKALGLVRFQIQRNVDADDGDVDAILKCLIVKYRKLTP